MRRVPHARPRDARQRARIASAPQLHRVLQRVCIAPASSDHA